MDEQDKQIKDAFGKMRKKLMLDFQKMLHAESTKELQGAMCDSLWGVVGAYMSAATGLGIARDCQFGMLDEALVGVRSCMRKLSE